MRFTTGQFMNAVLWFLWIFLLASGSLSSVAATEENEFAEFEEDEAVIENVEAPTTQKVLERMEKPKEKGQPTGDFDDDDFGIVDEEHEDSENGKEATTVEDQVPPQPLKFADVPAHFRSNWASYQVEALVLVIIMLYLVTYVLGRNKNQTIATECYDHCRELLSKQFALVGDDGVSDTPVGDCLRRETDYSFSAWCSGRVGVHSLLLQMRMVKRQDLVSRVLNMFKPTEDKLSLKVQLDPNEMDPLVMAVGEKKAVSKQVKDMLDLSSYATERKNANSLFNLPNSFSLFSEQSESAFAVLEPSVVTILRKHEQAIDFIHISDQYSGQKPPEGETYSRLPETCDLLIFSFNMQYLKDQETVEQLLTLVFYLVDKVRKLRLSKEAKLKADRKRKEFEENFVRTTHQFRQEAAQARREEKTRERKQRLLEEEDPEKQRRLEAKELKREAKSKQPKMKQLKMK
ncbi:unnamed protein product [Caenorhabditis auriculariae]|uniref:PAT complex subunit CCDC47 n=1 Tax=Caenorhabditis auriculariae TaxID=2777116 RepID=A0A8S1HTL3_9PELO|nr:unnamed protein product [Caenorhabditis auriculariae]